MNDNLLDVKNLSVEFSSKDNSFVAVNIPAHNIPAFKPSRVFLSGVKSKVPVS